MCDFNEWPWNPRSHYFARDLIYLNYYTCYNTEFAFVSDVLRGQGIYSTYSHVRDLHGRPWFDLEIQGQFTLNVIFHISAITNAIAIVWDRLGHV